MDDSLRSFGSAGKPAPSGADKQPWHFSVVTDPQMKRKIRIEAEKVEQDFYENKISDQRRDDLKKLKTCWEKPFLTEAPCLIVIFKEFYRLLPDGTKDMNYYVNESAGISIGFLINAIRNAGYASLTYTPDPVFYYDCMCDKMRGEIYERKKQFYEPARFRSGGGRIGSWAWKYVEVSVPCG